MSATILFASTLLQFTAAVLAFRLVFVTGRWRAWSLIAIALMLMGIRRSITFYRVFLGDVSPPHNLAAELVALTISVLMVSGVLLIGPLFNSIQRTQDELRKSEARFRDVAEVAGDWIWEMDSDLRFTFLSPRFFELYPFETSNIIGKTREQFTGAEREDKNWHKHLDDLENRKPFRDFEYSVTAPNGQITHLRVSGKPIFDAGNHFLGYRGTGTDVTGRMRTEKALEESRRALQAVVDAVPAMVNAKDNESRYIFINRYQSELYGTTIPDNAVGKTASELVGAEYGAYTEAIDAEVISTGQTKANYEENWVDLKGVIHDLLTTKVPLRGDSGDAVGIVTVSFDITERKKAETLNVRLGRIIERSLNEIYVFDAQTFKFIQVNRGAQENLGYSMAELQELTPVTIKPDFTRQSFEQLIKPLRDGTREQITFETVHQRKDDSTYDVEVHLQLMQSETPAVFVAIIQDITERKRAGEDLRLALVEAEQANQAKSEFLATMSHEFRTPLNAILGFSDILFHQYLGPPGEGKYREYAKDIHSSGEHLLELVNDLLDISTIEAGKQSLNKEMLTVNEMVAEGFNAIGQKAQEKDIKLITEVSKNLPPLYADRRATRQILLNLLTNAVKFTSEGGMITLSAKASKQNTTLKIADNGQGIPAEKLPNLADPFTRGEQDPHKSVEGWGLGLAITKSLVDLHDGKMDITSKVGKGTTVTVTMPNGEA